MRRIAILCFAVFAIGCQQEIVEVLPSTYATFSLDTAESRRALVVMRDPAVSCQLVRWPTSQSSRWRELSITRGLHEHLVELVDDWELVDRYRIDARELGIARECLDATPLCVDPGVVLSPGALSSVGFAAYVLYIPPEDTEPWTAETSELIETFTAVVDDCLVTGIP